jgi:hypothetical protein
MNSKTTKYYINYDYDKDHKNHKSKYYTKTYDFDNNNINDISVLMKRKEYESTFNFIKLNSTLFDEELKKHENIKLILNLNKEKEKNLYNMHNFLITNNFLDIEDLSYLNLINCKKFICNNCNLKKLPILNNCNYLDCNSNIIDKLPLLNNNIFLNCSYNKLTIINLDDFKSNEVFICNNNNISLLPELNKTIILDCSFNKIENIKGLKNCKELICNNNNINNLPKLKNCIRLIANNNKLQNIHSFEKCKYIDISNNNISFLPSLFSCIELNCSNNNIKYLPYLPKCKILKCNDNSNLYYTRQYSLHFNLDFPSPGYEKKMKDINTNFKNISDKLNKEIYSRYNEIENKILKYKKKLNDQEMVDEILKILVKEYLQDSYKKIKKLKNYEISFCLQSLMEFNNQRKNLQYNLNYISLYILDQKIRSMIGLLNKNPTYPQFKLDFEDRKQVVSYIEKNPYV